VAPIAAAAVERRLIVEPRDLAVLEFELSGLASAGGAFTAFAYAPTGALNAYKAGDRLADAIVRTVDANEVVLDTDEGPLRVPLAVPPR
jgi:hypothetical protein